MIPRTDAPASVAANTKKGCKAPSPALTLFVLVGMPVCVAQQGAWAALGTTGIYSLAVAWGAAAASAVSHLTRISFCLLAVIWLVLACLGQVALSMAG